MNINLHTVQLVHHVTTDDHHQSITNEEREKRSYSELQQTINNVLAVYGTSYITVQYLLAIFCARVSRILSNVGMSCTIRNCFARIQRTVIAFIGVPSGRGVGLPPMKLKMFFGIFLQDGLCDPVAPPLSEYFSLHAWAYCRLFFKYYSFIVLEHLYVCTRTRCYIQSYFLFTNCSVESLFWTDWRMLCWIISND